MTIDNIKEMELPELNDEFAQSLGDYESLDDLRSSVKENLEANKKQEYEQDYVSIKFSQNRKSSIRQTWWKKKRRLCLRTSNTS